MKRRRLSDVHTAQTVTFSGPGGWKASGGESFQRAIAHLGLADLTNAIGVSIFDVASLDDVQRAVQEHKKLTGPTLTSRVCVDYVEIRKRLSTHVIVVVKSFRCVPSVTNVLVGSLVVPTYRRFPVDPLKYKPYPVDETAEAPTTKRPPNLGYTGFPFVAGTTIQELERSGIYCFLLIARLFNIPDPVVRRHVWPHARITRPRASLEKPSSD